MIILRQTILLVLCLFLFAEIPTFSKSRKVAPPRSDIETVDQLKGVTPMNLLEQLKSMKRFSPVYSIDVVLRDWITLQDVRELVNRIESKTPCLHAVPTWSSYRPHEYSTEGMEAMLMIQGFIEKRYPNIQPYTQEMDDMVRNRVKKWISTHPDLLSDQASQQCDKPSP